MNCGLFVAQTRENQFSFIVLKRVKTRLPKYLFQDQTWPNSTIPTIFLHNSLKMAENDSELNDLFSSATASGEPLEADVLTELHSIMRLHSIPPQELFYKWESYSIKMGQDDMKLDIDTVRALKQSVQDGLEKENRKTKAQTSNKRVGATPRNAGNNNDVFGM